MTTNKNVEKYLWVLVVMFVTYLFLGSFIVSRNISDLAYLIVLYSAIIIAKINEKKK